jgi:phosphoribosyl 1,2-cyclic phosphodiesterase
MSFRVKFWGVRGEIAVSLPSHIKFGGNTSCIEVMLNGHRMIFNAGTGIRELGYEIMRSGDRDISILFTHTSWDHITGFPFFTPAYAPENSIRVFAGHLERYGGVKKILSRQMVGPMFPIPLETMRADLSFVDFEPGAEIDVDKEATVRTAPLNNPDGATGYRVDYKGKSIAVVAPTGHVPGKTDENAVGLMKNADLVIYDCTFSEEEFAKHPNAGHSTWEEGVRLCRLAGAKRMAMYHHSPDHSDAVIEQELAEARETWPGIFAAKDNQVVDLDD